MTTSSKRRSIREKAIFVLNAIESKENVKVFCEQRGVSPKSYYNWRRSFLRACQKIMTEEAVLARVRQREKMSNISEYVSELRRAAVERQHLSRQKSEIVISASAKRANAIQEKKEELLTFIEGVALSKVETLKIAGLSRATYYRWRKRFLETGTVSDLREERRRNTASKAENVKEHLFKILHAPPSEYGFNRTTWKQKDLQEALAQLGINISLNRIGLVVRSAGYRWRKARTVLTSKDPDYRNKLENVQRILAKLDPSEGFFSIDEYGPFAVKQTSGKKLVAPGEQPTVPQWQMAKGSILITAALELSTNQITHFYSEKKNTGEMIKLLNVLLDKYEHMTKIYLSWDAASWHISKKLFEMIEANNQRASVIGSTRVEVAPLPAGAQFLNVIESVFSGMSRAVIRCSNYESVDSAKTAIDRYFKERNEYFINNPQRAGKKIWGLERVPPQFLEGHNCKDPRY